MTVFFLIVIIVILLWQNGALNGLADLFSYLIEKIWFIFKALLWLYLLFGWSISPVLAVATGDWELLIMAGVFFALWLCTTYIFWLDRGHESIARGLRKKPEVGAIKLKEWLKDEKG